MWFRKTAYSSFLYTDFNYFGATKDDVQGSGFGKEKSKYWTLRPSNIKRLGKWRQIRKGDLGVTNHTGRKASKCCFLEVKWIKFLQIRIMIYWVKGCWKIKKVEDISKGLIMNDRPWTWSCINRGLRIWWIIKDVRFNRLQITVRLKGMKGSEMEKQEMVSRE